ncbi:hypothetical protein A5789_29180 [Nocardia sp. 852002-51101_SCH5132738]|nr:hypothetical protein A5789_29180 [Nocardia sp. 852002-51101_SCH5132738]OBB48823.1 hypothetical protein A5748_21270 [Nocardia sp. 852002-51244_SCH5132740]OBF75240.1 hypothetical protein A9X06_25725 [Mycobacterium sp. 852002-51759_SCH5129042]
MIVQRPSEVPGPTARAGESAGATAGAARTTAPANSAVAMIDLFICSAMAPSASLLPTACDVAAAFSTDRMPAVHRVFGHLPRNSRDRLG